MNKNKIDTILNINPNQVLYEDDIIQDFIKEETELTVIKNNNEIIPYTENPELIKDIDRFKKEREKNIETLINARNFIKKVGDAIESSIKSDSTPSAKEIDAFAKIGNTLVNITREIDEQTSPNKIEMFLDTTKKDKSDEPKTINNTQINITTATPASILKAIEEEHAKKETEKNKS